MIITHHREKLINAIIYFAKNTDFCGKTKLMKLLHYLDFTHFKQTGKSVTGLEYFAWAMGPVPKELWKELDSKMLPDLASSIEVCQYDTFKKIKAKKKFNDKYFTPRELKILKDLAFIFKEAKADDMIESTHLPNEPWDRTIKAKGENAKIDYLLAVDNTQESLSLEIIKERDEDIQGMYQTFGVK